MRLLFLFIEEALDLIVALTTLEKSQGILEENSGGLTYARDMVIHCYHLERKPKEAD